MKLFDSLKKYFQGNSTEMESPDNFCPNCWGKQEYGGQFYEAVKNENVNIDNVSDKKGWVLDYADKYLSDIQLQKQDDQLICSVCKLNYRLEK